MISNAARATAGTAISPSRAGAHDATRDDTRPVVLREGPDHRTRLVGRPPADCAPKPDWYRVYVRDRPRHVHRRDGDIETRTEIAVASDDAAEVRRVTLPTIARHDARDRADELRRDRACTARRRPGAPGVRQSVRADGVAAPKVGASSRRAARARRRKRHVVRARRRRAARASNGAVTCETDRAHFSGAGARCAIPPRSTMARELSGTVGAVLDPIFSLRARMTHPAGQVGATWPSRLLYASRTRAARSSSPISITIRTARAARSIFRGRRRRRSCAIWESAGRRGAVSGARGPSDVPASGIRDSRRRGEETKLGQKELWAMGISGDWPILLATLEAPAGLPSVRQLLGCITTGDSRELPAIW